MVTRREPSARDEMVRLLKRRVGEEISHDNFRQAYEEIFNFRLNLALLPEKETAALDRFFDVVARYSPLPADRAKYPGVYRDEREVDEALARLRQELGVAID